MKDEHMNQLLDLERQKLAIQFAAIDAAINDKIDAQTRKITDAVSGAIALAATDIRTEILISRAELKQDISDVRTELKADIQRLEHKLDTHSHN
ncbi:hypothetical protein HII36_35890 [Nonomuraea sp. NN258]|uniref:hypothetical protein n=1 Tax=Nonomuraea antri TaxID=2730852 RepID=UPI001568CDAA|nr:hypothetical protein [Nonomuraea antri]NRQ37180.1 hypothetical protein [Nonomuraea antri]